MRRLTIIACASILFINLLAWCSMAAVDPATAFLVWTFDEPQLKIKAVRVIMVNLRVVFNGLMPKMVKVSSLMDQLVILNQLLQMV